MRKLVAYFSASGTTKKVAERLAKAAGADLFEIRPDIFECCEATWNTTYLCPKCRKFIAEY